MEALVGALLCIIIIAVARLPKVAGEAEQQQKTAFAVHVEETTTYIAETEAIVSEESTTTTTTATTTATTTSTATSTTTTAQDIYVAEVEETVSDADFILLCNIVGHESGSDWITTYDKAKVVEVVMNRVKSPLYPDTIYGVITQPNQFSGAWSYCDMNVYSDEVTDSVKESVSYYFKHNNEFQHGYMGFLGDGTQNYFY